MRNYVKFERAQCKYTNEQTQALLACKHSMIGSKWEGMSNDASLQPRGHGCLQGCKSFVKQVMQCCCCANALTSKELMLPQGERGGGGGGGLAGARGPQDEGVGGGRGGGGGGGGEGLA